MYKGYKIVVVTPSGRKKYQEILVKYLLKHTNIIDEYRIWVNTRCQYNISWYKELTKTHNWITTDFRKSVGSNADINQFFDKCIDNNTIYIRLDDDIIYLNDNFLSNIIDFRIQNQDYFLVLGNIINNGICACLHQHIKAIELPIQLNFYAMNQLWKDPKLAKLVHEQFLKDVKNNDIEKYMKIDNHIMKFYRRFSVNAICWFGSMFKTFNGYIPTKDEEKYLTEIHTKKHKLPNIICSNALCSHYSFRTQRKFLDQTDILYRYNNLLS